jgi:hypothetical protein
MHMHFQNFLIINWEMDGKYADCVSFPTTFTNMFSEPHKSHCYLLTIHNIQVFVWMLKACGVLRRNRRWFTNDKDGLRDSDGAVSPIICIDSQTPS